MGRALAGDPRCHLLHSFFALAGSDAGFDPERPGRTFDAILVDIDHSPEALLDAGSETHLRPGGVFGLWSNDRPDEAFTVRLAGVFTQARAEPVTFHNPLQDKPFTQTVYLAQTSGAS